METGESRCEVHLAVLGEGLHDLVNQTHVLLVDVQTQQPWANILI